MTAGDILGVHHVKLPVTDMVRSRAWYERVFALEPLQEWPDDDGIVRGVSYRAKGGLALALREHPVVAKGITGFDPLAIMLRGRADIDFWVARLQELGIAYEGPFEIPIGWMMAFSDPDGLQLRFYTLDEQGRDPEGHVPRQAQ